MVGGFAFVPLLVVVFLFDLEPLLVVRGDSAVAQFFHRLALDVASPDQSGLYVQSIPIPQLGNSSVERLLSVLSHISDLVVLRFIRRTSGVHRDDLQTVVPSGSFVPNGIGNPPTRTGDVDGYHMAVPLVAFVYE